jgi:RNA polymerase sigma-70 factor (ECF subfamily)
MENKTRISSREERFRALYTSAAPRVLAYAVRRTDSPEDAIDVVAEAFTIAWRRFDDIPDGEASILWLYTTARRVMANHHRRAHHRVALVQRLGIELESVLRTQPDPSDDDRLAALTALSRLGHDDRELLMLAGWEGLDSAQLASILNCSPTAARIRLHRARSRLSAEMANLGIWMKHDHSPRHSSLHDALSVDAPKEA